jgi:hypothetical protein
MDPVAVGAVLLAIVSGAAGEASSRAWDGLRRLVRRPAEDHSGRVEPAATVQGGVAELVALEQVPSNDRAVVLAQALLARAGADSAFRNGLETWWTQVSEVQTGRGDVTSTITGGTQYGPVVQGRDFSGLTFHTSSIPRSSEE